MDFSQALAAGSVTPEQAFALFDALEPVDLPFLLGTWRGDGLTARRSGNLFFRAATRRVEKVFFQGAIAP
ncbi:GXWXG domain-containing protein [Novosphingobium profundi]|uniref:GXWXG domain-containing protein n=1 Tax=Novosphingobium profundi TaxID=1774954 RepID=UPI001CFF3A4F|nr:GXWXG domain-containing protein [Novosphingobium profundi]